MSKMIARLSALLTLISVVLSATAFSQNSNIISGKRYNRLVIRNAMIIHGNGKPASGPFDIVVENDIITQIVGLDPVAVKEGTAKRVPAGEVEIDATGKYVMPGLINLHGHTQDERGGVPQPVEYNLKMWLACGITTVRDVGGTKKTLACATRAQKTRSPPREFWPMECFWERRTRMRPGPKFGS
jgi:hypothetical protein